MNSSLTRTLQGRPTSVAALLGAALYGASMRLRVWRHRYRSRQELAALDDFRLADVGLTRADADAEINKRFWQA